MSVTGKQQPIDGAAVTAELAADALAAFGVTEVEVTDPLGRRFVYSIVSGQPVVREL